jgi:predicted nucleic acid-binding protein
MLRNDAAEHRIFVDTSALLALVSSSDGAHLRARSIERSLRRIRAQFVCTNYIVAEAHGLAIGRVGRDKAYALLQAFDTLPFSVVRVSEEDEAAARAIIERYTDKAFSLVDAISFVVMESLGIRSAFAFDDHFAQYGFATL